MTFQNRPLTWVQAAVGVPEPFGYPFVHATSGLRRIPKSPALRSLLFRTRVRDGEDPLMADDPMVAERGVLTASRRRGTWLSAGPR